MEIYNEGSVISSCQNTTYKNLNHFHPQNNLDRQPYRENQSGYEPLNLKNRSFLARDNFDDTDLRSV